MRILVVTRSYPSADDLYQYPFVHRRVLAYRALGHETAVFQPAKSDRRGSHVYEGVECLHGDGSALAGFAATFQPDVLAVHGLAETLWPALEPVSRDYPIRAWLHGSEIPGFARQKAECLTDVERRAAALAEVEGRAKFWKELLADKPERLQLVFVSRSAVDLARPDFGGALRDQDLAVIPNPIDTNLFAYRAKRAEDRQRILMIRPFDSATYGNDMAVGAIVELSKRSDFAELTFRIIGDGPLFDKTLAPVRGMSNVHVQRRFLTQDEIARLHLNHGIFLVPTRLDTQGVSRDEAMASGLVPVTNRVSAVPEFVDDSCAALAAPNDSLGLAGALASLLDDPAVFLAKSEAAAARVRRQSGQDHVIAAELALLREAENG